MAKTPVITYKRRLKWNYLSGRGGHDILKAMNVGGRVLWTSSVRGGIGRILDCLGAGEDGTILLPAMLPEGISYPLRHTALRVRHYRSTASMAADTGHIAELIEEDPSVKIVLIIHYMGIPQEIGDLSAWLAKKRIFLLEDCAQALFARFQDGNPVGSKGDVALFSLPKLLPVPDGGLFVVNNPDVRLERFTYTRSVFQGVSVGFHLLSLLLKTAEHDSRTRWCRWGINRLCKLFYGGYYLFMRRRVSPCLPSPATMRILSHIDYDEFVRKRHDNARMIHSGLARGKRLLFNPKLEGNYFLTGIPLLTEERSRMIKQMRSLGIECLSYSKAWTCESPNEFPLENGFFRKHLLVPIHEDMTPAQSEHVIHSLNSMRN